jgi:hypothetical protein
MPHLRCCVPASSTAAGACPRRRVRGLPSGSRPPDCTRGRPRVERRRAAPRRSVLVLGERRSPAESCAHRFTARPPSWPSAGRPFLATRDDDVDGHRRGYIGGHVLAALRRRGCSLEALQRRDPRALRSVPAGAAGMASQAALCRPESVRRPLALLPVRGRRHDRAALAVGDVRTGQLLGFWSWPTPSDSRPGAGCRVPGAPGFPVRRGRLTQDSDRCPADGRASRSCSR